MEVQKQGFQNDLKMVKEKLKLVEFRSEVLAEELKALKVMQRNLLAIKSLSMTKKVFIINENEIKGEEKIRHA